MKISRRFHLGVVLAAEKKENFSATVPMFVPSNESGKLYKTVRQKANETNALK